MVQGQYVSGLDSNALRISVLAGDVVLRNLQLKPEALNSLDLPITVKAGLLGSLKLKVGSAMRNYPAMLSTSPQSAEGISSFRKLIRSIEVCVPICIVPSSSPQCPGGCTGIAASSKLVTLCPQIPWRSLGQSPVIVEIDSIFVLACPKTEADVAAEEATAVSCSQAVPTPT